jgi:hypothetical protein
MTDLDKKALGLAQTIVDLWNGYSDENSERTELAMRDAFKEVEAMDLGMVDGVLASPLKYFARAYLNDENPEDLTYCEMTESLEISIGLAK